MADQNMRVTKLHARNNKYLHHSTLNRCEWNSNSICHGDRDGTSPDWVDVLPTSITCINTSNISDRGICNQHAGWLQISGKLRPSYLLILNPRLLPDPDISVLWKRRRILHTSRETQIHVLKRGWLIFWIRWNYISTMLTKNYFFVHEIIKFQNFPQEICGISEFYHAEENSIPPILILFLDSLENVCYFDELLIFRNKREISITDVKLWIR